ncbi:MAG: glycerate-2-kinase family protein, partial [Chloroflexota bacterium]|nr:glycerate-2-kinase family protein [Chloroflexota bacterium]
MSEGNHGLAGARRNIEAWYRAALEAVEPSAAVRRHLERDGNAAVVGGRRVPVPGRLVTVGVGKAAVGMALGVETVLGDLVSGGLVITKDGHAEGERPRRVRVAEAAHPIPDARGVRATQDVLELVAGLGDGDVVLALISGGGSALLEAPRPPVTVADLAMVTDLLLRAGAPIDDLNAVRTPLSLVKGGGLRRAADQATVVTLVLSDVL